MDKVKVSVIMGVYNCEQTIRQSIDSIMNQTFNDWEFIICDDGSKDKTCSIVEEYVCDFPEKFVLLKNDCNLGLNATLNKCLEKARGFYIARQDGDDISSKNRFQKEVDFLDTHLDYALVSSNMTLFDESGKWGEWKNPEKPTRIDFFKNSPCFCHAPCMIRRDALVNVEGYTERKRYLRCEDINLWYKLYANGYKGYNIQESLYSMRDDKSAFRRRTFKNRINIIITEFDGMQSLDCHGFEYYYFLKKLIKHFILAFIPKYIYKILHKKKLS